MTGQCPDSGAQLNVPRALEWSTQTPRGLTIQMPDCSRVWVLGWVRFHMRLEPCVCSELAPVMSVLPKRNRLRETQKWAQPTGCPLSHQCPRKLRTSYGVSQLIFKLREVSSHENWYIYIMGKSRDWWLCTQSRSRKGPCVWERSMRKSVGHPCAVAVHSSWQGPIQLIHYRTDPTHGLCSHLSMVTVYNLYQVRVSNTCPTCQFLLVHYQKCFHLSFYHASAAPVSYFFWLSFLSSLVSIVY